MKDSSDTFYRVKSVIVLHFLRQQLDFDLRQLKVAQLLLKRSYVEQLERIHKEILLQIVTLKRSLRNKGVKVLSQEQNTNDFTILYIEKGYRYSHSFRMEPLLAEAQNAFDRLIKEQQTTPIAAENGIRSVPSPAPILSDDHLL